MEAGHKVEKDYAVIKVGAHSYRVAVGDKVKVEYPEGEANTKGNEVVFDKVLLRNLGAEVTVGSPTISNASVTAKVIGRAAGNKVVSYKKTRRQGYHKKKGHRQDYLEVEIAAIA